jgi:hypothetical protein
MLFMLNIRMELGLAERLKPDLGLRWHSALPSANWRSSVK